MTPRERLGGHDVSDQLAAIEELGSARLAVPDDIAALAECLASEHKLIQRRAAEALAALHGGGAAVQPVLLAAMGSSDPRQRWGAAYALALVGTPPREALPVLLDTMGLIDSDVRWAAAEIVLRMKSDPALIPTLIDLLGNGNAAQRKMAAYCLRDLGLRFPGLEEALLRALDDADINVRLAAMSALARTAADRAVVAHRLLAFLQAGDERLRRAAAATLGMLGDRSPAIVEALHAALRSPDPGLRRAAGRAIQLLRA